MREPPEAEAWIFGLGLEPHPEGGYFRRTYRHEPAGGGRGDASSIYFLVTAEHPSRWHRIRDASEVWFFHAGSPLELAVALPSGEVVTHCLGVSLAADECPQAVVPAGAWQTARTLGDWTLVGCSVAPAFELAAFELAPEGFSPLD